MRKSKYTLPILVLTLIFGFLMVIAVPSRAANDPTGNPTTYEELSSGHWVLTDTKVDVFNKNNFTKWTPGGNTLNALTVWVDQLKIQHTISSNFKIQEPPAVMPVGSDLSLQENYLNDEYSSTVKVLIGVKVYIDKAGTNPVALNPDAVEVINLVKDNTHHTDEVKTGFFTAPKRFLDDSKQFQMTIDCFSGNDHRVTTYTYTYQN